MTYTIDTSKKIVTLETLPKSFKKLTGTRFATILGLNVWSSPFEAWCQIVRLYEQPFTDSINTIAGKIIEPKVAQYLQDYYFMDIKVPEDVYGADPFKTTFGDFFRDKKIFGGMWDALGDDFVVEIKTTKRIEDWVNGIPMYYKLQACLYAYLLGFDDVTVTVSALTPEDLKNPENFVPSIDNTQLFEFKISEEFNDFEAEYIKPAIAFWNDHVLTGISPEYDVNARGDVAIIKELRTERKTGNPEVKPDSTDEKSDDVVRLTTAELDALMVEADKIMLELTAHDAPVLEKRKRLRQLKGLIKKDLLNDITDKKDRVEIQSPEGFTYSVTSPTRTTVDVEAIEHEYPHIVKNYMRTTTVNRMNVK